MGCQSGQVEKSFQVVTILRMIGVNLWWVSSRLASFTGSDVDTGYADLNSFNGDVSFVAYSLLSGSFHDAIFRTAHCCLLVLS